MAKKKHPGGRPTRYHAEWIPKYAASLASRGLTDEQIAREIGIGVSTLYRWKDEKPEFREALEGAKEAPDDEVERSLFERATGYEHPEEKMFFDAKNGDVLRAMTTKHYPPDTAAAIIWLKNRRPEKWRDKQVVEHENLPPIYLNLPDNGRGPKE
jgi:hypothetical protein